MKNNYSKIISSLMLTAAMVAMTGCTQVLIEKKGAREVIEGDQALEAQNYEAAEQAFRKAASISTSPVIRGKSLGALAELCSKSIPAGCPVERRIQLLQQASALGDQSATYDLAQAYLAGSGINKDESKAKQLLTSIKDSYPQAAILLAATLKGLGGKTEDLVTNAMSQYHAQATTGNDTAMLALARVYRDGSVVPQDLKMSAYWYRRAIALGNSQAAVELANLWMMGGMRQDAKQDAAKLLIQAADSGDTKAMKSLAQLYASGDDWTNAAASNFWFEKAAMKGDTASMAIFGEMLLRGEGVKQDTARGLSYLQTAATKGSSEALLAMGRAYMDGVGVPRNTAKGMDYIRQAEAKGEPGATLELANASASGIGAPRDLNKAFQLYQKAAQYNLRGAYYALGEAYTHGYGTAVDPAAAIDNYQRALDMGSSSAARELAILYQEGKIVPQDMQQSIHFAEIAANNGDLKAMGLLGEAYMTGNGVPQDSGMAIGWYQKAAQLGHVPSMYKLAKINADVDEAQSAYWLNEAARREPRRIRQMARAFEKGDGVTASMPKAMTLYERAAAMGDEQAIRRIDQIRNRKAGGNSQQSFEALKAGAAKGDPVAMYGLGDAYQRGRGTQENKGLALEWYNKAAAAGNGDAMVSLGKAYALGAGVNADMAKSAEWYRKAAEAGNPEGQYQIGLAYAQGLGVNKNIGEARNWLGKAKENGYPLAETVLLTLTPDE
ncbi:MAG: hypothetical protein U1E36_04205 [Rickettsiales bacterium]